MTTTKAKIIALQQSATCSDCGRTLPEGAQARYYSDSQVYCLNGHQSSGSKPDTIAEAWGLPPRSGLEWTALLRGVLNIAEREIEKKSQLKLGKNSP